MVRELTATVEIAGTIEPEEPSDTSGVHSAEALGVLHVQKERALPVWMATEHSARRFAHDLRSLVAGVQFGTSVLADNAARGVVTNASVAMQVRDAAGFLAELFEALGSGTADRIETYDLWAVARLTVIAHGDTRFERPGEPLTVRASRLDGARLVSLLLDNAVEHGTWVHLHGHEGSMVVTNGLPRPDGTDQTNVRQLRRSQHERGTGLVQAPLLAARLGLQLTTRRSEAVFVATLSRL